MTRSEMERLQSALVERLLAGLASCAWQDRAERNKLYQDCAAALERISVQEQGRNAESPVQDYEPMFRRITAAIETAVMRADSLEDVRRALRLRKPHTNNINISLPRGEQQMSDVSEASAYPGAPQRYRSKLPWGILAGMLLILLVVEAAGFWLFLRTSGAECSANSTTCFDSGWQPVSNATTTIYYFRHRLGQVPRTMTVWFSPTADGSRAFLVTWKFPRAESGNPVTIEAQSDVIYVNVWSGIPIHGVFDATDQKWTTFQDGFYRIVASK